MTHPPSTPLEPPRTLPLPFGIQSFIWQRLLKSSVRHRPLLRRAPMRLLPPPGDRKRFHWMASGGLQTFCNSDCSGDPSEYQRSYCSVRAPNCALGSFSKQWYDWESCNSCVHGCKDATGRGPDSILLWRTARGLILSARTARWYIVVVVEWAGLGVLAAFWGHCG